MEKFSLYRKYRPSNFENLVGQGHIKTTLQNAIKNGQIAHSYIFSGPRGTGKTSTARLMAKAINCINIRDSYEPCDSCDFCKEISNGNLIDVVEMDAASNTGVDYVRDLKDMISYAPTRSKNKVYIIDEVHMLSKSAFNALLKTLEEPPTHVYFILATTELHKIPETIISRCQNFEFKRISVDDMTNRLISIAKSEGINAEDLALKMIAKHVNGGLRDAIVLLEQLSINSVVSEKAVTELLGISSLELLNGYYEAIKSKDSKTALAFIEKIYNSGIDLRQFLHDFINLLREKIMLCFENNYLNAVPLYYNLIEIFQLAIKEQNPDMPKLSLEMASIKATFDFKSVKVIETLANESVSPKKVITENIVEKKEIESPILKVASKKETESPIPKENFPTGCDSIEDLKAQWISVLKHISKPTIQRSLRSGQPMKIDGDKLLLKFVSSFHSDVVMKNESRSEVETAIFDITGKKFQIESVVEEMSIASDFLPKNDIPRFVPNTKKTEQSPPIENKKDDSKLDKATNEALDIFGGSIVG